MESKEGEGEGKTGLAYMLDLNRNGRGLERHRGETGGGEEELNCPLSPHIVLHIYIYTYIFSNHSSLGH